MMPNSFSTSRRSFATMNLNVETEDAFVSLLELAANNDFEGFKKYVEGDLSGVDEVGLWYGRKKGSNQMVLQHMTPLMVAATYGSVDVLKLIVSFPEVDVNRLCGSDNTTALHCAASGGSVNAVDVVKLLLAAGADPNLEDGNGRRPVDVIVVAPNLESMKDSLRMLLAATDSLVEEGDLRAMLNSNLNSISGSPPRSLFFNGSPSSPELEPSKGGKSTDISVSLPAAEKKEYPIDPSLPDIKNSIYSTDEFRMFSFKVRPCSRAYSHDWTECPFVHPGENARRRDPRKYHYSCVPCPDFRKGACRRGDMCEYAHGVFECWLHPAQYRTRLCKDGTSCNRRVCFFAHTQEELRPLYVSTGSAVPSPRSATSNANSLDFAAAMSLLPGSPSSVPMMSPNPFTPPMSPSTNGISTAGWPPQQNVPSLHFPGSNLQSSRLRSSFSARDIPPEYMNLFGEIDVQQQLVNELPRLSQPNINTGMLNRPVHPKSLTPSNLEDMFSAEGSSPRYADQTLASAVFSPTHKTAVLNQFQHQQQSMLSPIKTSHSPRNVDHSLMKAPFGSGRMSPQHIDPVSPMSARMSILARHDKQQFRSLSSRDLNSNAAAAVASFDETWSKWGNPSGPADWAVGGNEFGKLKRSSSFELLNGGEEPDLSWVQSLVKESPQDLKEKSVSRVASSEEAMGTSTSEGGNANKNQIEQVDESVLGAWLEKMRLDQLMAQ
ncbi:zinc finger CCCH domain-containing protein 30 [Andrographis paniculata]|uniref:zinc finger CCCH domain-containing protein 30 n=1 Tax=Andrographis paniculata TaxID=175694 RepID=UPI0021E79947|nr:zinc finger CCCH domain-containing protein 30 [Andrographis paniculata]